MLDAGRRTPKNYVYSRISMLSKLKYVGVCRKDLIEIYCLFVRSRAEYCSVAFHSSLTQEQSRKIENIQKTSLRIILHDEYDNYESACHKTGLFSLFQRRENRSLTFARRCLKNKEMSRFFPFGPRAHPAGTEGQGQVCCELWPWGKIPK